MTINLLKLDYYVAEDLCKLKFSPVLFEKILTFAWFT